MPSVVARRQRSRAAASERTRGQSLAELALILPVLLLLVLVAIDFGRVYLGYINLQQMARVAGNYAAEHASAWEAPTVTEVLDRYQQRIRGDATAINCDLPEDPTVLDPTFSDANGDGTKDGLGDVVTVRIGCTFHVLTPIISTILGDTLSLTAEVVYPVREGVVAEVPGGGAPIAVAPVASFIATPRSGYQPLDITFTDTSDNAPTDWSWDFGNGTDTGQGPHTRTYSCPAGSPEGLSCTFDVTLTVTNGGGSDTATEAGYITVTVPPATGPVADFLGSPVSATAPVTVRFCQGDLGMATCPTEGTFATYAWDFDYHAPGSFAPGPWNPSHEYETEGTYSVALQVTDAAGATQVLVKTDYITVARPVCTVPDFGNARRSGAQDLWSGAGFTTTVTFQPAHGNDSDYKIHYQSLVGGTIDPQPLGCDSAITVGP